MLTRITVALTLLSLSGSLYAAPEIIEPPMVLIPGGEFAMGSDSDTPVSEGHLVTVQPFKMGQYEVTVKEFGQFIATTGYEAPDVCTQMASKEWFSATPASWQEHNHLSSEYEPVTCIGWNAAQAYVQWLAQETGKNYRLPSEAEWEYAAKAGTTSHYYWSEDTDHAAACAFANIADLAAEAAIKRDYDGLESKDHVGVVPCDDQAGYASIVGMYKPNGFGLHDMIGNINEFTQDCFNDTLEKVPADGSAYREAACKERVIRGGTWHWAPFASTRRGPWRADFVGALEGFRIAESIPADHACTKDDSKTCKPDVATQFEKELAKAQKAEAARRAELPNLSSAE